MRTNKLYLVLLLFSTSFAFGSGGYKVGDKAADFKLKNVDGKYLSLDDYKKALNNPLFFPSSLSISYCLE